MHAVSTLSCQGAMVCRANNAREYGIRVMSIVIDLPRQRLEQRERLREWQFWWEGQPCHIVLPLPCLIAQSLILHPRMLLRSMKTFRNAPQRFMELVPPQRSGCCDNLDTIRTA